VVEGDSITNLTALGKPEFASMLALIDSGEKGLEIARKTKRHNMPLKDVKLLAP
jgi:hypothetical protein